MTSRCCGKGKERGQRSVTKEVRNRMVICKTTIKISMNNRKMPHKNSAVTCSNEPATQTSTPESAGRGGVNTMGARAGSATIEKGCREKMITKK